MPIDPVHLWSEPPHPDWVQAPEDPPPATADAGLRHESRRSPHPLVVHRNALPVAEPDDPSTGPDAPQLSASRLLEEIEARLVLAPRDDLSSLQGALWSYQRLVEQLLSEDTPTRSAAPLLRGRWLLLRELHRRLRQHLRSTDRQPPMR